MKIQNINISLKFLLYLSIYLYDKNKWISQTLTTGLVVIFWSLFKDELLQTEKIFEEIPQLLKCRKTQKIL